jgi:hypothetical protein
VNAQIPQFKLNNRHLILIFNLEEATRPISFACSCFHRSLLNTAINASMKSRSCPTSTAQVKQAETLHEIIPADYCK